VINVNVPADAKIYVNDKVTSSTGESRRYVSRDLAPGFKFSYEIRAEKRIDGRLIRETKTVQLGSGETANLDFTLDPENSSATEMVGAPVETKVTLNVPAHAAVTLAGNPMRNLGATRVFSTLALAQGETWKDYNIEVTVYRNGQPITKSKTIDLTGGDVQALEFDFDEQVASL